MAEISIGIASDTRAFASGIRSGVLQPLEDVEKSLDGVERASDDATAELVGGFKGAQRATKDLERDNKDLAETIQREARKSSRAVRDIGDEGFSKSSDAVRGFKDEATQNFSEVASSFDGSIQGIADGVQGTLGGLASSISGPIGLALGGLGIIAGTVGSAWAAQSEQIAEDWQTMYDDMVESGAGFLSQDLINRKIQELVSDQGKLNAAVEEAKTLGVGYTDVVRAQAGDLDALSGVYSAATEKLGEQNAAQEEYIRKNGEESAAIADKQGEYELLIEKYGRLISAQDGAASAAETARRAMDESTAANGRTADSLDRVADSANAVPSGRSVVITADTRDFEAAMERIRRQKYSTSVGIDVVINERRGRQTVD